MIALIEAIGAIGAIGAIERLCQWIVRRLCRVTWTDYGGIMEICELGKGLGLGAGFAGLRSGAPSVQFENSTVEKLPSNTAWGIAELVPVGKWSVQLRHSGNEIYRNARKRKPTGKATAV